MNNTIYFKGENMLLKKALKMLTDDTIDSGSLCNQTTIDLRDACKAIIEENDRLEDALKKAIQFQFGEFVEILCKKDDYYRKRIN